MSCVEVSQYLLMQYRKFVKVYSVLADIPDYDIQYILDGGTFLQCIPSTMHPMHGLTVLCMEMSATSAQNM